MPALHRPLPFLLLGLVVACASDGRREVRRREPAPAPVPAIVMSTADPSVDLDLPPDTRPPLDREAPAAFATATFALG